MDKSITRITNIAQVNIVIGDGRMGYHNGPFIPVFQDALRALASIELTGVNSRVLLYILGSVDEKNCISVDVSDIAESLKCSRQSVYNSLRTLEKMQIICHRGSSHGKEYELESKIVNPRLAYKGNTRKINCSAVPLLLEPETLTPILGDIIAEF